MSIKKIFFVAALLLTHPFAAQALELSGVKIADTQTVSNTELSLNGAGVRYKAVFKVYVATLYLGKKTGSVDEVLAQPGPKRLTLTMLRDIDANELGKLFARGMEDNIQKKSEFPKLIPNILRMGQLFNDYKNLKTGDTVSVDWIPQTGTVITIKGKPYGEPFKEPEFYNALLRIWLGSNPADWKLKDALLGRQ